MASHFVLSLFAFSLILFADGLFGDEISYVEHGVLTETNRNDVNGLAALQSKFYILQIWSGDPCTGSVPWTWLLCTSDPTPRVTALYLGGFALSGTLPDFSSMDALETIDLSNNFLTGPIPDFLGNLPNLQQLNLVNNNFQGTIPTSLSKNPNLTLMISGNANLCTSDKSCKKTNTDNTPYTSSYTPYVTYSTTKKKKNLLPLILGILIPVKLLFWVVVGFICISRHKRKGAVLAAMAAATPNIPETKGREGEITTITHMDQQTNTYANANEHDVPHQQHVNL